MTSSYDPFAEFAAFAPKPAPAPAPAPAPEEPEAKNLPIMSQHQPVMQQQPAQQQQQGYQNPFGGYNASSPGIPQQQPNQFAIQQQQGYQQQAQMVPAVQQTNQWGVQQPPIYQQPVVQQQQQQQMAPTSQAPGSTASYPYMTSPTVAPVTPTAQQQPYMQQQRMAPSPVPTQQPAAVSNHTAPSAVVQEDDDFFGEFSNTIQETSPNRPPSVFEANGNDDVSYLSKSTGGGTERGRDGPSPLDDPKFAPKPPAVHGLANAQALAQHAPPGSSTLPDFDLVTHSGYVLARISFRTILIKKWKQSFWITYGGNQVLFFRSSADFEDWISNPYLSQAQRDFLVKLRIDFVEDVHKQSVKGYQLTPQRLKNYNNKMLHQFKLERWMDYGPTIAAAFASPNEREVRNLRTVFTELKKKSPNPNERRRAPTGNSYNVAPSNTGYGNAAAEMQFAGDGGQQYPYSSSASTGRLEYRAQGGSVMSQHSNKSYGVLSTGPVEMSRDPQYVAGYRVTTSRGRY